MMVIGTTNFIKCASEPDLTLVGALTERRPEPRLTSLVSQRREWAAVHAPFQPYGHTDMQHFSQDLNELQADP